MKTTQILAQARHIAGPRRREADFAAARSALPRTVGIGRAARSAAPFSSPPSSPPSLPFSLSGGPARTATKGECCRPARHRNGAGAAPFFPPPLLPLPFSFTADPPAALPPAAKPPHPTPPTPFPTYMNEFSGPRAPLLSEPDSHSPLLTHARAFPPQRGKWPRSKGGPSKRASNPPRRPSPALPAPGGRPCRTDRGPRSAAASSIGPACIRSGSHDGGRAARAPPTPSAPAGSPSRFPCRREASSFFWTPGAVLRSPRVGETSWPPSCAGGDDGRRL